MKAAVIRKAIKKQIDELPDDRLASLADYVAFLNRPTLRTQIDQGEADVRAGKVVDWRHVRSDV